MLVVLKYANTFIKNISSRHPVIGNVFSSGPSRKQMLVAGGGVFGIALIGATILFLAPGKIPSPPQVVAVLSAPAAPAKPQPDSSVTPASSLGQSLASHTSAPLAPVADSAHDTLAAKPSNTPVSPTGSLSVEEQIKVLEDRLNNQERMIRKLQTGLKVATAEPTNVAAGSSTNKAQSIDEADINLLSVTPNSAIVRTTSGNTKTIPVGKKLPGGATFLSYDPSTQILKTSRGSFSVEN